MAVVYVRAVFDYDAQEDTELTMVRVQRARRPSAAQFLSFLSWFFFFFFFFFAFFAKRTTVRVRSRGEGVASAGLDL